MRLREGLSSASIFLSVRCCAGCEERPEILNFGIEPKRTGLQSPWQNGVAERFVGSCRRDLLDHVIVLNERHLKRLIDEYVSYHHDDRTHLGLDKKTPAGRAVTKNPAARGKVLSLPRLGGLHHRYQLAA